MNELHRILGEMTDIDRRLETPGALVSGQRDELVARRRSLQARFDALQQRPDYLSQVHTYTASALGPRVGVAGTAAPRTAAARHLAIPA